MPEFSKHLFWDVNPESIDFGDHRRFVIGRVLTRGKWEDWRTLKKTYDWETLKQEVVKIRDLDKRTLAFCSTIFEIPKENFRCSTNPAS